MKVTLIATTILLLTIIVFAFQSKKVEMVQDEKPSSPVVIDAWSDIVCPFCYVGKKKLEKAISELNATNNVQVNWHSFQLDPTFPIGKSMSTTEYLVRRKGYPKNQVIRMQKRLETVGLKYGIDFQFNKAKSFNTGNIHRLIQWAKTEKKANELKEQLMFAYFTKGTDLNDTNNILSIVSNLGLDTTVANSVLTSSNYKLEVDKDIAKSKELGIRGVPYFLINGTQVISGAQDDQVFIDALKKALSNTSINSKTNNKEICLPNGKCE